MRALRISEYGDPEKDKEALIKLSPITYIHKMKAPFLMLQGANDPRVNRAEEDRLTDGSCSEDDDVVSGGDSRAVNCLEPD